jgi:hypothetical protein
MSDGREIPQCWEDWEGVLEVGQARIGLEQVQQTAYIHDCPHLFLCA